VGTNALADELRHETEHDDLDGTVGLRIELNHSGNVAVHSSEP